MANCEQYQETILTDYIDGQLSASKKRDVENHLMSCLSCRMFAQKAKQGLEVFNQAPRAEADPFLWQRIKRKIEETAQSEVVIVRNTDVLAAFLAQFKPYVVSFCLFVVFGLGLVIKQNLTQQEPYLSYVLALDQGSDDEGLSIENYFL